MGREIKIIQTAKNTNDRLNKKESLDFKEEKLTAENSEAENVNLIKINRENKFQSILGFGGAFTEAAAYTLAQISKKNRDQVIKSYFDPEKGLNYSIGRVHIHSCDFALENYTYVETGDDSLESFDITRDHKWVLPLIKNAKKERGAEIKLLASPWSPPAWMKTNGEMNNGGQLLPEYRECWAKYYTRFIKAYRRENMDIWGITIQNEPAAVQTWDSCIYNAEAERDFLKDYLGPTMESEDLKDVNILIWDHNRDIMLERAKTVLSDPAAAKYVWGTGFHWYQSEEFENVGSVHNHFPDKHLLFTEGCQEGGVHLGDWSTGERYGRNMIGDLNNWTEGYLDWNLVLNEQGGPNHVGNYCDAPIIADTNNDELHYNSSYYYIGHFSKYIQPEARRIEVQTEAEELQITAFENPDQSIAVVVMNEEDIAQSFVLKDSNLQVELNIPAHAIQTLLY